MASLSQVRPVTEVEDTVEPPVEATLVQETLAGDESAFGTIVRLHSQRVFNFLNQMTRNASDAEDLAQQTFIKAYKNLHRFDVSRSFTGWLLVIARRSALNHFRAAKSWTELPETLATDDSTPAVVTEQREAIDDIWEHARSVLSERQFQVMWLRYGEDLSVKETARVAGLTQTHVKCIVFRARRALLAQPQQP